MKRHEQRREYRSSLADRYFENQVERDGRGIKDNQVKNICGNNRRKNVVDNRARHCPRKSSREISALEGADVLLQVEEKSEIDPRINKARGTHRVAE